MAVVAVLVGVVATFPAGERPEGGPATALVFLPRKVLPPRPSNPWPSRMVEYEYQQTCIHSNKHKSSILTCIQLTISLSNQPVSSVLAFALLCPHASTAYPMQALKRWQQAHTSWRRWNQKLPILVDLRCCDCSCFLFRSSNGSWKLPCLLALFHNEKSCNNHIENARTTHVTHGYTITSSNAIRYLMPIAWFLIIVGNILTAPAGPYMPSKEVCVSCKSWSSSKAWPSSVDGSGLHHARLHCPVISVRSPVKRLLLALSVQSSSALSINRYWSQASTSGDFPYSAPSCPPNCGESDRSISCGRCCCCCRCCCGFICMKIWVEIVVTWHANIKYKTTICGISNCCPGDTIMDCGRCWTCCSRIIVRHRCEASRRQT